MDFNLIPLHRKPSGIRLEDDDAEIPWVKTATLLAGAILGEVEAEARWVSHGFDAHFLSIRTCFDLKGDSSFACCIC